MTKVIFCIKLSKHFKKFAGKSMKTYWNQVEYHPTYDTFVPKMSGIYAVLRVERAIGIPINLSVLYIGKSKNLQRRFRQHTNPYLEHNKALNKLQSMNGLEFWFFQVGVEKLDELERKLIRELIPVANIVRYAHGANN